MATVTALQDHIKPSKKVRLIAKIRDFNPKEHNSEPWIRVREDESSNRVVISFGGQSDRDFYEVDSCYEQGHDNLAIYSREIKPLLPSVYDGQNLTIIGFGARGSGKTYTILGNEKEQGLAALATSEILSGDNETGISVYFSLFEVFHEHVYDLLGPKRPEVQVLEDAQGNIKLKGLSEVILKSVSEVQKLFSVGCNTNRRSHKGLIVKVSSKSGPSSYKIVGKLTIVDLAGFVDARRKSCDGVDLIENSRINKSLYALLNVVHAANANEPRVPFRESKLTRILQDSFGATNRVLLLTCLNPFLCQDTVFTLSLASRSCQGVNQMSLNSMQKSKYLSKPTVSSAIKGKLNVGSSAKKQASSTPYISMRNKSLVAKDRKIDHKGKDAPGLKQSKEPSASEMQSRFFSEINSEIASSSQEGEESMPDVLDVEATKVEGTSILHAFGDTELKEGTEHPRIENRNSEVTPSVDGNTKALTLFEGDNKEKEKDGFYVKDDGSPPLSSRLRELSNNLRNLYNSTPIQIKLPPEADSSCGEKLSCTTVLEPKTPVQDKLDLARFNSPWEKFNARSSGLKHSLADEYLKFINSASKEELKGLPGIGEKRATYILELREESPEPFKNLEDLKDIGLSAKQINGMMKKVAGDLFNQ